jgi:CheY-like chemotaxis protein
VTVLLVEDVRVSRRVALQALQRNGYTGAMAVDTGAAAIEAFRQHAANTQYHPDGHQPARRVRLRK